MTIEENLLRAWKGDLDLPQLVNCADQLEAMQLRPLAAVLYQTWLNRNESPNAHFIYFNLGVSLFKERDLAASGSYLHWKILFSPYPERRLNEKLKFP